MKKRGEKDMVKTTFIIEGEIKDFPQIDNLYRALKREGAKLLKNYKITVDAKYEEREGKLEIPE